MKPLRLSHVIELKRHRSSSLALHSLRSSSTWLFADSVPRVHRCTISTHAWNERRTLRSGANPERGVGLVNFVVC
jgi:hypothetical protein